MKNKQKWWRSQPKAAEGQPSNRKIYKESPNFREWHNPSKLLMGLFSRVTMSPIIE